MVVTFSKLPSSYPGNDFTTPKVVPELQVASNKLRGGGGGEGGERENTYRRGSVLLGSS